MRIIFAATEYCEQGKPTTGFPNYLKRVSLALIELGHTPVIIAGGRTNTHRMEAGIEIWTVRITHIDCKNEFVKMVINSVKKGILINKKIKEVIKEHPADIIQFTSLSGIGMFYCGKTPAVMRLSSYAKTYFSTYQTYNYSTVQALAFMERASGRRMNAIFAPCKNTAEAFGEDCKRCVKVIETPFVNDVKTEDKKYYEKYLKGKKYVLFFGTLYAEKGILVIAKILEKFLESNPFYHFVFVGDVTRIGKCTTKKIIEIAAGKHVDRVFVWQALPHEQLYPIIKKADFVVLPSLMDNFPNTCIEAMYFKRIVIGTNGASFEQLIEDGYNGFLCEIGNADSLLKKMQIVVNLDSKTKTVIEERAGKRIKKLQPKYVVRRLIRLYQAVLHKGE